MGDIKKMRTAIWYSLGKLDDLLTPELYHPDLVRRIIDALEKSIIPDRNIEGRCNHCNAVMPKDVKFCECR
jgi:hypothetical protein